MTKPLTAQQIAQWADGQEVPDISVLACQLDIEGATPKQRKFLAVMTIPQLTGLSIPKQAALAGISERYAQILMKRKDFRAISDQVIKQVWGNVQLEMQTRYVGIARNGDKGAIERILEQGKSLARPEKGGDTNIAVTVTIEEAKKLEKERDISTERFIERCGYDLLISDN